MTFLQKNYASYHPMWCEATMLQSNTVSSPTLYAMVALCVLSVGFMIRFLIALVIDGKKIRVDYPVRLKGVRCPADVTSEEPRSSEGAVNPAAHLAMGVVRLASALTSKPSRGSKGTAAYRLHITPLPERRRELGSKIEHRYRSS
jgi:hypothetical protein